MNVTGFPLTGRIVVAKSTLRAVLANWADIPGLYPTSIAFISCCFCDAAMVLSKPLFDEFSYLTMLRIWGRT